MDCKKFIRSSSEKVKDSPNDNDSSEDVFQDQSEKFDRNTTRTGKENLSTVGQLASENERLPSPRSVKVSYQPPTPFSQAPNIDQLDETFLNTDVYTPRELRSSTSCSRSADAVISPQQNPTASSISVLEDSDASRAKTNQRNLSPFAANRNADFSSPPERDQNLAIISLSKNLKETNTPSPEKRSVETDEVSTPIKRLRNSSERHSGKPGTKTESYRFSAAAETYKSPTNLHIQQMKAALQKNEESESLNSPSTPSKRKRKMTRNSSVQSKTANDPCLSNLIPPSTAANIVHKSPTNLQMHGSKVDVRNVDESPTERKTLISYRGCSTDSNSLAKNSEPDGLHQTASFLTLPKEEHESVSNESTDASSANPNLKTSKQKGTKSSSDMPNEGALPNFTSKKDDTIMHPTTLTDASLVRPNNVSRKQRDRLPVSDVSFEVVQPDLPVKETESAVHPLRLTDETSSSDRGPASKSQNSTTVGFESCVEVKKIQDSVSAKETQSASNVTDSAIETQVLKSSQSSPIILNPHLPSSCHLPRRSNSSVTKVPHRILEFDTSDKKVRIDQNRSDFSTRTPTPDGESRSQSKELSVLRSRGMHRRSLSDKTLASKTSPELYQSNILQGIFPRSHSKESSTSRSLEKHRRSVSDETLTPRNLTEVQAQEDQSDSLIRSRSKETPISRSLPEISEGISRTTCVVQPLFRGMPPRSVSNTTSTTSNTLEFSHSGRSNQLLVGMTETLPSNESSTSRNNPEIQLQRNRNDPSLQMRHARFLSGEASTSRNQPEVAIDINSPYIDVVEGQASTSRYQPIVAGGSSFDQASTSRGQPEVVSDINPPYIDVFEGHASTSRYQPVDTGGSSSFDQSYFPTSRNRPAMEGNEINLPVWALFRYRPITTGGSSSYDSSSEYLTSSSSDVSESGEAGERTRGTFEPFTPSRPDEHVEYLVEARFVLLSVLKELMLYKGDDDLWRRFEASFRRTSESCTELERVKLCTKLACYLANRGYDLWNKNLFMTYKMTAETCTQVIYEKLNSTVVGTLALIVRVAVTRDFSEFIISYYTNLTSLYREFSLYSTITNAEDIQDEVSRNRVKKLKKMIHSLLLRTSLAFRLLLMYIGENSDEEFIERFEYLVSEEDKMFLRRKIE
ncbi:hypothetical protein AVEN_236140-1 [Araneus ventricosus]|uniref:Uncharacterized protein n=1 Tax=Araneus ventricosus TaxID=182803 RepID=A0A4Y2HUS7_ARAVE|nr:hypothetical protein AVEN_236140-1 [Araneus ventricosus]